jgi:hypothetical protein
VIFSIDNLINSIAAQLKTKYPALPVYDSYTLQGCKFPCFFVFLAPSNIYDQIDAYDKRELNFDVVYVQERNAPNAYGTLYTVADTLDELLEMVTYADGEESIPLHTHERNYSIDDQELHYKFRIIARVSRPVSPILMQTLEEDNVRIKKD